jgi:hypothetical protein
MAKVSADLMDWLTCKLREGRDSNAIFSGKEPDFQAGYGGPLMVTSSAKMESSWYWMTDGGFCCG